MSNRIRERIGLVVLAALTLAPATLRADLFIVTRFGDANGGACTSACTLREAVLATNQHPGLDVIALPPGVFRLTLAGANEDLGATGDLDITDALQIVGSGLGTVVDGGGLDRVFDVLPQANVTLTGITIRHGAAPDSGGGLRNHGHLTLYASVVTGNTAPNFGFGGGIYSDGAGSSLKLDGSTVSGNVSDGGGGGLTVGGALTATDSTLSGNRSLTDFGGGVYLFTEAQASFNNVTIIANQAAQRGGGLFAETPDDPSSPAYANSIIAGNSASRDAECLDVKVSGGYNLIGQGEGCPGFSAALGDQTGTAASPLAPRLAPLADNGGPTPTHSLLPGSPAINHGNPAPPGSGGGACEPVDQRLFPRRFTRCDIGSFERKATR